MAKRCERAYQRTRANVNYKFQISARVRSLTNPSLRAERRLENAASSPSKMARFGLQKRTWADKGADLGWNFACQIANADH
jgi:hypothetical protein